MSLEILVISQHPPGGRYTLYAGYAELIEHHLNARADRVVTDRRDAHGEGFPSLWLNGASLQPGDGVILMPADVLSALAALGIPEAALNGLAAALEVPLQRMLEMEG